MTSTYRFRASGPGLWLFCTVVLLTVCIAEENLEEA